MALEHTKQTAYVGTHAQHDHSTHTHRHTHSYAGHLCELAHCQLQLNAIEPWLSYVGRGSATAKPAGEEKHVLSD